MLFLQPVCPTGMISCTLQVRQPRPGWGPGGSGPTPGARTPPGDERFRGACPRGQGTHPEVSAVAHVEGLEELLWAGHLYPLFTQPGRAETRSRPEQGADTLPACRGRCRPSAFRAPGARRAQVPRTRPRGAGAQGRGPAHAAVDHGLIRLAVAVNPARRLTGWLAVGNVATSVPDLCLIALRGVCLFSPRMASDFV